MKYKKEYDEFVNKSKKNKIYDSKTKKWKVAMPKESYVSKAVRHFYADLKHAQSSSQEFKKAYNMVNRAFQDFEKGKLEPEHILEEPPSKRYRLSGAGPKLRAPEIRDELFQWFIGKQIF